MNYSNMYNNNNNHDWSFMNYNNNNNITEPLREPVPFEDFQFSLGLDPEFAMPIPLDMPPPPPPMSDHDLFSVDPSIPTPLNNAVLDEQDHKAFSQFLDQFFVDPNMQIDSQFSMYQNNQPPPMSLDYTQHQHHQHHQEEYNRQTHILHSLDEQKRYFNQKESEPQPHERPGAVYLQSSNTITAPYIKPILRESSSVSIKQEEEASPTSSSGGSSGGAIRRGKPHKELLTEEEKRSNHIASEQKRRSMIRSGFKDLTEIVPTLKNINNSKSTVLFKAVDYIKYLEKRNRNLREKIKNLEVRVEVEGRMGVLGSRSLYNNRRDDSHSNNNNQQQDTNNPSAALLQHKTQQRQLMELQEKLQIHQKMLAQQRRMFEPRWNNDKPTVVENKMEVDTSPKTTVSA
ncbi:hypothetical protein BDF21DRAFT_492960 [Thamnidium elegans]|nr:hypothetical protein BDF21DRAFT_492960 [Thamnidium elegans]